MACEFTGAVRDAFTRLGHDATSCDLSPPETSGRHYEGRLEDLLKIEPNWDLIIAHPPCTYLCVSGLHWNKRVEGRAQKTEDALAFVQMILDLDCPRIALENPIGCISSRIRKPEQIIQPYQFGGDASKATCLWLKGLPKLVPTEQYPPRVTPEGKKRWGNQTDSGQNRLGPSPTRAMDRSRTYPGIAEAMALQWSQSAT